MQRQENYGLGSNDYNWLSAFCVRLFSFISERNQTPYAHTDRQIHRHRHIWYRRIQTVFTRTPYNRYHCSVVAIHTETNTYICIVFDGCRRYTCTMCAFALVFSTEPANNGVHVRHRVVYACGNNHIVCSARREPRCVYVFHVFLCCCCVSCCCVWVECEVCACRHHCICVVCWCSPHSTNSICAWMECGWSVQLRRLWTVRSVQIDGLTLHWFLFLFCV